MNRLRITYAAVEVRARSTVAVPRVLLHGLSEVVSGEIEWRATATNADSVASGTLRLSIGPLRDVSLAELATDLAPRD